LYLNPLDKEAQKYVSPKKESYYRKTFLNVDKSIDEKQKELDHMAYKLSKQQN
jgi:hypothetical protein